MSTQVAIRASGLTDRQIALARKTKLRHLDDGEFEQAIEYCRAYNANPLLSDIYFFVHFADDPKKRQMTPVCSIGLYRKMASRAGNYRPDEAPPRFVYDESLKDSPDNPKGIVSCEVTVHQHSHGSWHPITERLRWDERAPLKEVWEDGKPSGKFVLDPKKRNWHTMSETMIAKCVEASAIRKGWPEETAGSYAEGELDQAEVLELTATEITERFESEERKKVIGVKDSVTIDWLDGRALDQVPAGVFGDRAIAWLRENAEQALVWQDRNRHALRELWVLDKAAAMAIKRQIEGID